MTLAPAVMKYLNSPLPCTIHNTQYTSRTPHICFPFLMQGGLYNSGQNSDKV